MLEQAVLRTYLRGAPYSEVLEVAAALIQEYCIAHIITPEEVVDQVLGRLVCS